MELRNGYRQTEIGVFPNEWAISSLGELFSFKNGVNADKDSYGQGIPFVNVLEAITYSHLTKHDVTGRVTLPEPLRAAYAVKHGDVLFNRTSETETELALAATYVGSDEVVFGGFVIRARPLTEEVDPKYCGYALRATALRSQIIPLGQGAVRANIGQKNLSRVLAPVPPISEQRAIATALSDVDALITGLERLIAKKRDIKQATMQQLLSGQTRLPGFGWEWEHRRLGDFVQFLKNGVNSRAELEHHGDVKYLHYGDIHGASGVFLDAARTAMPCLPRAKASALDRLRDGDLVLADASEDMDGIGKAVELRVAAGSEVVSGLHTIAARFDKHVLADGFKAYLQFMPQFSRHLKRLAAGTKVFATNRGHVASAELNLPGVEEQVAISSVLSDMDADLSALEARLTKTRAIKQGMMQELLTGRTRLLDL
jgi:type I restriction enzyme S subunit